MPIKYNIIERKTAVNTAVAAGGTNQEIVIAGPDYVQEFNSLEINNTDAMQIQIKLDNDPTKTYLVQSNLIWTLRPEEGIRFRSVAQVNTSAGTAETAGAITFIAFNKREVI